MKLRKREIKILANNETLVITWLMLKSLQYSALANFLQIQIHLQLSCYLSVQSIELA